MRNRSDKYGSLGHHHHDKDGQDHNPDGDGGHGEDVMNLQEAITTTEINTVMQIRAMINTRASVSMVGIFMFLLDSTSIEGNVSHGAYLGQRSN